MFLMRGSFVLRVPTGNKLRFENITALRGVYPNKKRRTIGGPFAALSGGMSDSCFLEQRYPSSTDAGSEDNESIRDEKRDDWKWLTNRIIADGLRQTAIS